MKWVRFGRKQSLPNHRAIAAFAWRGQGKPQRASVRIAAVAAEICTEHF
jgi:hypothetical protein